MEARVELLIWTALSLLLGVVAVNAAHRAQGGRLIQFAEETTAGALLREVGLFAFMVGLPFGALISGASGIDLMALGRDLTAPDNILGFPFVDWARGIGQTSLVVASALAVLWLAGRVAPGSRPWGIGVRAVRDAFYNETHWTFYRAAPALWLGDFYWGVVIGMIPVLLEWITHPDTSFWLATVEGRQVLAVRLACLFSSGFLYLAAHNLWLMIAASFVIQVIGSRLISYRAAGLPRHTDTPPGAQG